MPQTLATRTEYASEAPGKFHPSGTYPGATKLGFRHTSFGKSGMAEQPDSGRTLGNRNLEWRN
jgi:hypothetical protein